MSLTEGWEYKVFNIRITANSIGGIGIMETYYSPIRGTKMVEWKWIIGIRANKKHAIRGVKNHHSANTDHKHHPLPTSATHNIGDSLY